MSKPELHGATLPDGWIVSHHSRCSELLLIERPKDANGFDGFVSIDLRRRIFDGNECNPVRHAISGGGGPSEYRGRNWAKRLIEGACAWLEKTMTT